MKVHLHRVFVLVFFVCGLLAGLAIPGGTTFAQIAEEDTVQHRVPVSDQRPGTVYLLNDSYREVRFALSYDARKWEDYALNPHHACSIPAAEFGHDEVVIRYIEKIGSEKTLKLEVNERYRFVYNASLKEWSIERLR